MNKKILFTGKGVGRLETIVLRGEMVARVEISTQGALISKGRADVEFKKTLKKAMEFLMEDDLETLKKLLRLIRSTDRKVFELGKFLIDSQIAKYRL